LGLQRLVTPKFKEDTLNYPLIIKKSKNIFSSMASKYKECWELFDPKVLKEELSKLGI